MLIFTSINSHCLGSFVQIYSCLFICLFGLSLLLVEAGQENYGDHKEIANELFSHERFAQQN